MHRVKAMLPLLSREARNKLHAGTARRQKCNTHVLAGRGARRRMRGGMTH
jgi:hypothetical protein